MGCAFPQRTAFALVGLVADAANLRILGCGALDLRFGAVAAAVVDDQQLVIIRQRADLPRSFQRVFVDDSFFIIAGIRTESLPDNFAMGYLLAYSDVLLLLAVMVQPVLDLDDQSGIEVVDKRFAIF